VDFEAAGYQSAENVLRRLVECFHRDPLRAIAISMLPAVDFDAWWQAASSTRGGRVGSGSLNWPTDRAERVSIQLRLLEAMTGSQIDLTDFALDFCYASSRYDDNLFQFSQRVLRPFLRDFVELAELRASPPVLAETVAVPPVQTGDQLLDDLLQRARDGFRDPNPTTRRIALEKVWDAWERLKTLEDPSDKRRSSTKLLDKAASEPAFRQVLETEAHALTAIGNDFHIRHFEADRAPLIEDAQVDYFFHRMWAFLWLLLTARRRTQVQ
jgi:hypothetical protein